MAIEESVTQNDLLIQKDGLKSNSLSPLDKDIMGLEFTFNLPMKENLQRQDSGKVVREKTTFEVKLNADGSIPSEEKQRWFEHHVDLVRGNMSDKGWIPLIADVIRPEHAPELYAAQFNAQKSGDTTDLSGGRVIIWSYFAYLEPDELHELDTQPFRAEAMCEFIHRRKWKQFGERLDYTTRVCAIQNLFPYHSDFETIVFEPTPAANNTVDVQNEYYDLDYLPHTYTSLTIWEPSQQYYYDRKIEEMWYDYRPKSPVRGLKQFYHSAGYTSYNSSKDTYDALKTVHYLQSIQTYFNVFHPQEMEPYIPVDQLPKVKF